MYITLLFKKTVYNYISTFWYIKYIINYNVLLQIFCLKSIKFYVNLKL